GALSLCDPAGSRHAWDGWQHVLAAGTEAMGGLFATPGDSRDYSGHRRTGCSKPGSGAGDCQTFPRPRFAGCCTAIGPSERLGVTFPSTTPGNGKSPSGRMKTKCAIAWTVARNINGNLNRLAWGEKASTGIEGRICIPAGSIPDDSISGPVAERERGYTLKMIVCGGAVCRAETAGVQAQRAKSDGWRGSGGEGGCGSWCRVGFDALAHRRLHSRACDHNGGGRQRALSWRQDMGCGGASQVGIGLGCTDRQPAKGERSQNAQHNDRHRYNNERPLFN